MSSAPPTAGSGRVVVVGGGPAGLTAAIELRRHGVGQVVVLDRERVAGGAPRHTDHLGFGMRDVHRLMTGPRYAAMLAERATHVGVDVRTGITALEIVPDGDRARLRVATPDGLAMLDADAVIVATGVRERPRSARLIPGDRPAGVFTTGSLQQFTALHHQQVGTRAVIVGAEHVSFSAIITLAHSGCTPVAMVTSLPRHQSTWPLRLVTATRHRVPLLTERTVAQIVGRVRVEQVVLDNDERIACDTVVFTGDWIADDELLRRAGVTTQVGGRTTLPTVFVAGNVTGAVRAADRCALDGRRVALQVLHTCFAD